MKNIEITLQQLFDFLDTSELSYNEIKAVNEDIYILTPDNSYAKLRGVIKKQDEKLKIKCGDIEFICGERHILISEEGNEVFAKDATYIMSIDGPLEITEKTKVEYGDVFDVSIDAPHLYMTPNGIVHHNTTAAFALCNELDADVLFINASMESGIDVLRSKIQSFASTVSFGGGTKIVILDEADGLNCLEENETVRIGTVEDWSAIPLKDLDPNLEHSVVSFNMETGKFENDTATVISNSSKETFELELETGETVIVTGDHPFIVTQDEKTFIERTINEGLEGYKIVCYNLKFVNVKSIKPTGVRTVINLTVNKNHTFVTGNGIVTHNCNSFQPALRGFIETFSANCRFILTCNFPQKLIEPIHSRCTVINFAIDKNEKQEIAARFFKRACGILTEEKVEFDQKVVAEVVTKYFPDYRRVLNELQRYSVSGKIDSGILSNFTDDSYKALIGFLKDKNFTEVRKWVGSNEVDTVPLFRYLYDYSNTLIETNSIPQLILIMADYSYKSAFVADQELNVMAALTEIMSSVVFK